MSADAKTLAWLRELLADAANSPRPSAWERSFLADIAARLAEWGASLSISERQMQAQRRIEAKIYAAG